MAAGSERTRLCLVVPADAGAAGRERLVAALVGGTVASVILAPRSGTTLDAASARPVVDAIQRADIAALIWGDARLARTLKADGVHLPASDDIMSAYGEAREILGRGGIVGADAGTSRHDAMQLGEAGADYIGFSLPPEASSEDVGERLDRVQWWAEIFEPPCVAFDVTTPDDAAILAATGVDFVAFALPDGASPADARDCVSAFARAVADATARPPP
jgi:thiamine-phosphate pyrophosphorylase